MEILFPTFGMALLTFLVSPLLIFTRVGSVNAGIVTLEYYREFRGGEPPSSVVKTSRHWAHLFEAPVLFYTVCLVIAAAGLTTPLLVQLGWAYVVARVVHTAVHLTFNQVMPRLSVFMVSQVILIAMWVIAFLRLQAAVAG